MASHPLLKFARHKWLEHQRHWEPFVAIYYLTYACDFRCPYCSNGEGIPYHRLPEAAAGREQALRILGRIRRHADHLVLTGGEPLQHPEAAAVLAGLPALKFASVALTTNGEHLPACLPEIAASVSTLGISLDTLDARKADAWFGRGPGMLARILENIEQAANFPDRRYEMLISAVATPNNIADLYAVYDYSQKHGFQFAATPELHGVRPPEKLPGDPAYREFFDFLCREQAQGANIFGSRAYLEYLRDFRPFRCRPLTTLTVAPQGDVYYPCLERAQRAGNILDADLDSLRRRAEDELGLPTACPESCHSACAVGLSLLIEQPAREGADALQQGWQRLRRRLIPRHPPDSR